MVIYLFVYNISIEISATYLVVVVVLVHLLERTERYDAQ